MLCSFALPARAEIIVETPISLWGISYKAIVSAYTASVDETDSRPWEMASGETVYEGAVANNCLKFGTKVVIGETLYVVEDRMNKRYGCEYYDILFPDKASAVQYGRQNLEVVVVLSD